MKEAFYKKSPISDPDPTDQLLSDIGEFDLISKVILPMLADQRLYSPLGDDCSYVELPDRENLLVITTDATPKPLAWNLGYQSYEMWGWYSVLINVSDLAAAGASPLAFTSSIEASPDMSVHEFRNFLRGLKSACEKMAISNAGGNVRAAPRFESHGTAIGTVPREEHITRAGCKPGDLIFIIGESGQFIAAYLKALKVGFEALSDADKQRLVKPVPQIREMNILRSARLISAASDNSDGLLGTFWNIAEPSGCAIEIELRERVLPHSVYEVALSEKLNPWNMFLFWGDWQVVVAVQSERVGQFSDLTDEHNIKCTRIGRAISGEPCIYGISDGKRRSLNLIRQENFRRTSYNTDIDEQLKFMLRTELFQE